MNEPVQHDQSASEPLAARTASRRTVLTGAAALAAAGFVPSPAWAGSHHGRPRTRLTVLGSTDLHGHVYNWDYYKDAEYDDAAHNDVGVAKVATLISAMRRERRGEPILTLDAGDTIQGTPLAQYYAMIDPIGPKNVHPMARAMNLMGYDAAALGNHEFNYGIDLLRTFESQVNFPLLGANAVDPSTGLPVFPPYLVKHFRPQHGPKLTVGVLGLTNPGIAIWDKANVSGRIEFPGLVEQATKYLPELKRRGCDIVVIAAHSGMDTSSSYGDALPYPENASTLVAAQVPDVDAILVGHAHSDIPERFVTNEATGRDVLLSEPYYWGMRLAVMDLDLELANGRWQVVSSGAQSLNSNTVRERPDVAAVARKQHQTVVDYVNSVIGTSKEEMLAARAVVEDVPIIDFVNYVQADAVKQATGTDLPVLSIAAPFNRQASFKAGDVTVRDVAGLYIYDNTLLGIQVTGAELKQYLEYSARYFQQVPSAGSYPMDRVTNAKYAGTAPNGVPDYNYDAVMGLDAPLTYDIDLTRPPADTDGSGERIVDLAYGGTPVADDDQFVMAINNYRQSGGGGFPAVKTAPVVYNQQVAITQLLIDWVTAHKVIDPAEFASVDWRLVGNGQPLTIT
ncbi:MAG TPA: 5'-nucleotidase C-terminal domain-containing protein [Marmoricola sp.]|nr:5'-nucleotidase C-terminal domain-containing protein [Marmoricola sp.]